jgi:hypothetical protein
LQEHPVAAPTVPAARHSHHFPPLPREMAAQISPEKSIRPKYDNRRIHIKIDGSNFQLHFP